MYDMCILVISLILALQTHVVSLSLLPILGFEFPDYYKYDRTAEQCLDSEGVSLQQRSNQLARRVRVAKKKKKKKKDAG